MAARIQLMPQKTAAVIGATGLIGSALVKLLQTDSLYETVRLIVRRPVQTTHPKEEMKLVNFDDGESLKLAIDGSDVVFCAVGTTQKKVAGDKAAYRRVDFDIPVNAARYCQETGCQQFLLVSAVGANSRSKNFYLRLKGETEDAIKNIRLKSISFFRPSVLIGKRAESRSGERLAQGVMQFASFLLVGRWDKYRPIDAEDVAKAMLAAAKVGKDGVNNYEFTEMDDLVKMK